MELDGHVSGTGGKYEISFPDADAANTNFVAAQSTSAASVPHTVAEFALVSGKKYYFRVAAVNLKGGIGFKSNEKQGTVP
jgi:predicted phage tail protein